MEQREIHFSGNVQGVGFRFTTHSVAGEFRVTGFVQNLEDGRVRLVVEGEKGEIDRFLQRLNERMGYFIRSQTSSTRTATGQYADFSVAPTGC